MVLRAVKENLPDADSWMQEYKDIADKLEELNIPQVRLHILVKLSSFNI